MYAYIKGTVEEIGSDSAVIDNNGIGYRVFIPGSAAQQLRIGEEVKLHTHFSVREDAMQLFGFLTRDDLEVFRLLIGVSGIGPKGALGILTVMDADDLRFAVLGEDAAGIARAPGIGKKTAQKVIIELRDKLDLEDAFEKKAARTEAAAAQAAGSPQSEAVLALQALGYTGAEAARAVKKVSADLTGADTEDVIRAALKELF